MWHRLEGLSLMWHRLDGLYNVSSARRSLMWHQLEGLYNVASATRFQSCFYVVS